MVLCVAGKHVKRGGSDEGDRQRLACRWLGGRLGVFEQIEASGPLGASDAGVPGELRAEPQACGDKLEVLGASEVGGLGGVLAD